MCGICGIVDLRGTAADLRTRLPDMVGTLRHRGPDQSGIWADADAGLGHARLSIIDLADGKQPLSNEDGTVWITYNGEVYNFPQLRKQLVEKGHTFRTHTDTEVIVHLYEDEGIECVNRLRGMFAFGIWDARRRTIYLVRDRLGIKPLYYTILNGRLIFGSEIKAILAHGGLPRQVREDALSDYLTFQYVPAPKSMFQDVFKLEPGHWLRFDSQGVLAQQYWDLKPAPPLDSDRRQIEGEIIEGLSESVRLRLVSDVPLGAFLSGGVDSSAVVAMMKRANADPLITTSVGFEEDSYNELPFARQVAGRYQTQHFEETVRPEAANVVEALSWHYDEPFADYSAIPTYYVSRAAKRHVKVALSGDGGDENFAGYPRYRWAVSEERIRAWLPGLLRRWILGPLARLYPQGKWLPRRLRAKATLSNLATDYLTAYSRSIGILDESDKLAFLTPELLGRLRGYQSTDLLRKYMNKAPRDPLGRLLYTEIKTYLVDDLLAKVDRASMAVSLEVRVPLLDHVFVEYAQRVPAALKIDGREGKAILKSSLRPFLDSSTLYRAKHGFTPPVSEWIRGPLREMVGDLLLPPTAKYASFVRRSAVERAWAEHQAARRDHVRLLWALLMFELWARRFL